MLTYERYAQVRDERGLTDYKMSVLTGVTKATFSGWKHGTFVPKIETQLKIAKVLKLTPKDLVSRSDIKNAELPGDDNG